MKQLAFSLVCSLSLSASAQIGQLTDDRPSNDPTEIVANTASGADTSDDHSSSPDDMRVTAAIRHDLILDSSLATIADQVKIITGNGTVLLQGSVNTMEEKMKIGQIALRDAGNMKIDNQIDVSGAE